MSQLSFRDPDGFLIRFDHKLYRVILKKWNDEIFLLKKIDFNEYSIPEHSSLDKIVNERIIDFLLSEGFCVESILSIMEVHELKLITYPWEWTPSMLIDAAIHTLELQKKLMKINISLKDATFFNIQFRGNHIYFLDLLSLKKAKSFYPWIPYGQFLRHFIYPSTLLKYNKISNLKLMMSFTDGLDFKFAQKLVPARSLFNIYELLHYQFAALYSDKHPEKNSVALVESSPGKLNNLLDLNISYLLDIKAKLSKKRSYWAEYYSRDVSSEYYNSKTSAINELLTNIEHAGRVLDIGANIGEYSMLFLNFFSDLICIEKDTICCEILRQNLSKHYGDSTKYSWYVINSDIVNPGPAIGWMNKERTSLINRIRSELVTALGLIHHIYFTDSIDFHQQADLFYSLSTRYLMVEFISSEDEKVKLISVNNKDRINDYCENSFLNAYSNKFKLITSVNVSLTRQIYLFEKIEY